MLHSAAKGGQGCLVSCALMIGADENGFDSEGSTPLMAAAKAGHLTGVNRLIAANADVNRKHRETGATALMVAAGAGKAEVVDALLAAKAAVDLRDNNDRTAYSYAFQTNQFEVARKVRYIATVAAELPSSPTSAAFPKAQAMHMATVAGSLEASEQRRAQRRAAAVENRIVSDSIRKAQENQRRRGN